MRKIGILGSWAFCGSPRGCGRGDPYYYPPPPPPPGPGLLGIEDTENLSTARCSTWNTPCPFSPATITVDIYSDYLSDSDIANDPYSGSSSPGGRTRGERSSSGVAPDSNMPFYRSFLDFPLAGRRDGLRRHRPDARSVSHASICSSTPCPSPIRSRRHRPGPFLPGPPA